MVTTPAARVTVPDDLEEYCEYAFEQGWTDGLPVIPPTPDRVARMLQGTRRDPAEVVAKVAPLGGRATVEVIAVSAVMAGCRPEYMPVLISAVEALTDPAFNLYGVQTTTNPVTPALMVNGPVAKQLGINGAGMAFGPGFRANSAMGRAIRLILMNAGGAHPQKVDKATHGQPGMFSFLFAENEAESPWEPYHVRQGFQAEGSTVTAFSVCALNNVLDAASTTGVELLNTIMSAMVNAGTNNVLLKGGPLVVFCPEHADLLARDGYTPETIQRLFYEHARVPIGSFSRGAIEQYLKKRRDGWVYAEGPGIQIPVAGGASDFALVVAGGPGQHSVVAPSFNESWPVTKKIDLQEG